MLTQVGRLRDLDRVGDLAKPADDDARRASYFNGAYSRVADVDLQPVYKHILKDGHVLKRYDITPVVAQTRYSQALHGL
jgi:hypothetical protein